MFPDDLNFSLLTFFLYKILIQRLKVKLISYNLPVSGFTGIFIHCMKLNEKLTSNFASILEI